MDGSRSRSRWDPPAPTRSSPPRRRLPARPSTGRASQSRRKPGGGRAAADGSPGSNLRVVGLLRHDPAHLVIGGLHLRVHVIYVLAGLLEQLLVVLCLQMMATVAIQCPGHGSSSRSTDLARRYPATAGDIPTPAAPRLRGFVLALDVCASFLHALTGYRQSWSFLVSLGRGNVL